MSSARAFDPYGGLDPREIPAYGIGEAAHYLWVPGRTLEGWVRGYAFGKGEARKLKHAVVPADADTGLLSFSDLLELHVLVALRREHGVSLQAIRRARLYLQQRWGSKHPLITEKMATDGKSVFVHKLNTLIDATHSGQLVLEELISARLQRLEWDESGLANKLYPYTMKRLLGVASAPKSVLIDARQVFGRPVLTGTRIPTEEIAGRFFAGESRDSLLADFGCTDDQLSEAIRYEAWRAA